MDRTKHSDFGNVSCLGKASIAESFLQRGTCICDVAALVSLIKLQVEEILSRFMEDSSHALLFVQWK